MIVSEDSRGFSLIEMLIALTVFLFIMIAMTGMLIQNSRINKAQQLRQETQATARNCLEIVVQRLRSSGWDPTNAGVAGLVLDPDDVDADHADGVNNVGVFADLNGDGETDGTATNDDDGEELLIRHNGTRVEWRTTAAGSFVVVAEDITNDADGDGVAEPMFLPDADPSPTRVTVQISARSAVPEPGSNDFFRYTVRSVVVLRGAL